MNRHLTNGSPAAFLLTLSVLLAGCSAQSGKSAGDLEATEGETASVMIDDMILDMDEMSGETSQFGAKGFTAYRSTPWTNGVVPVKFDSTVSSSRRTKFLAQCARWSKVAKVRCVSYTSQAKFLLVTAKDRTSCYANVGMGSSAGTRVFNFGLDWCWNYDWAILHDLGHTFGLIHEHQRSDRDKYVQVLTSNILTGYVYAFDILSASQNVTPYDFRSIMQYPSYSYAKAGKKSMIARPAYAAQQKYLDVQPTQISAGDAKTMVNIYGPPIVR